MAESRKQNFEELREPSLAHRASRIFDDSILPIDRLKLMDAHEFEELTAIWILHSKNCANVCTIGGSKDGGRDIVAYYASTSGDFDIYQCKHYSNPMTPSVYCVEFGKLCYYTWIEKYRIPIKYYIVCSNGVGDELRGYLEHPDKINTFVLDNWGKYCARKRQITKDGVVLTNELRAYIEKFDFSMVDEVSPETLIHQMESAKAYKYFFGGGLKKRPRITVPPDEMEPIENTLPYVKQLFDVYSEILQRKVASREEIQNTPYGKHLFMQRHNYYSAQCLARFVRDELFDDGIFGEIKTEIDYAITHTSNLTFNTKYERVESILDKARSIPINNQYFETTTLDKCGICHELVNEGGLCWHE